MARLGGLSTAGRSATPPDRPYGHIRQKTRPKCPFCGGSPFKGFAPCGILGGVMVVVFRNDPVARASLFVGGLAGLDLLIGGGSAGATFAVFGLGVFVGALAALAQHLIRRLHDRLPGPLLVGAWLAVGATTGAWLGTALGVLARLGTKDHRLAVVGLAMSVALGLGVSTLGLFFAPLGRERRSVADRLSPRGRQVTRALAFSLALACAVIDRKFFPDSYAEAHLALRIVSLVALYIASVPWFDRDGTDAIPRRPLAYGLLASLAVAGWLALSWGPAAWISRVVGRPLPASLLELCRALGDFDGDGHSAFLQGGDCRPFDRRISPGAVEIPGNGIDDNCRLGDVPVLDLSADDVPVPSEPSPRSVVLVTVDTVHAGHLQPYGYDRETTPNLMAWSENARVYERAYTTGGWTSLAVSSMLRGVYPRRLRWTRLVETNQFRLLRVPLEDQVRTGERGRLTFGMPVEDEHRPLAWWLSRRGMNTAAVINDGYSEFLDAEFVGEGFERFVDLDDNPVGQRKDADVTRLALRELASLSESKRPFFLWVHYFGPHSPSRVTEGIPIFGDSPTAKYDHEIAVWDAALAPLLRAIDDVADTRPLTLIVTADHGEWVRETVRGHGKRLNADTLRIPLFVWGDAIEAGRESGVASLIDILPTVLALTETPGPSYVDGIDLRSVGDPANADRILLSDTWRYGQRGRATHNLSCSFDGEHKLIFNELKQSRRVVAQRLFEEDGSENLDGRVDTTRLQSTLDLYLEYGGALQLHD